MIKPISRNGASQRLYDPFNARSCCLLNAAGVSGHNVGRTLVFFLFSFFFLLIVTIQTTSRFLLWYFFYVPTSFIGIKCNTVHVQLVSKYLESNWHPDNYLNTDFPVVLYLLIDFLLVKPRDIMHNACVFC